MFELKEVFILLNVLKYFHKFIIYVIHLIRDLYFLHYFFLKFFFPVLYYQKNLDGPGCQQMIIL